MKPGRNDPCWCNSGVKYKKCHLDRDAAPRPTTSDLLEHARASYSAGRCLHPEAPTGCEGPVTEAHTIQKRGSISPLARGGKVYAFPRFAKALPNIIANKGRPTMVLVGAKEASTFPGFCNKHDQIFRPVETDPIVATGATAGLLAYRSVAREVYAKQGSFESARRSSGFDAGLPAALQQIFQASVAANVALQEAAIRDMLAVKKGLDAALIAGDWSEVRYRWYRFTQQPVVGCSGLCFPIIDFAGSRLQSLNSLDPLSLVTFSVIPRAGYGFAMLSWWGHSDVNDKFAASLDAISDTELAAAWLRFVFGFSENLVVGPDWWDQLAPNQRSELETIQQVAVCTPDYPDDMLKSNLGFSVDWGRVERVRS